MSVLATLVDMEVRAGMVSTRFPAFVLRVLLGGCVKQVKKKCTKAVGIECTQLYFFVAQAM